MTPDDLRALADALEPMAKAPCFDGIDIERAADYLRAQADAQPVAWMYEHDGCVDTPLFTVNRWTKCEEPWNESPLFLHPAPAAPQGDASRMIDALQSIRAHVEHDPSALAAAIVATCDSVLDAAPQAEPIDPHMIVADNRFPDVPAERWKPCPQCGEDVDRECPICDGLGRVLATDSEQAEPKREPLSDERITKGEYVLATKFSDGDPGDHWGVGFYDRLENGRHYIVDRAGQQIRGSGFRRAARITMEVGIWLLSAAKSLEASPPGTVNLWTMLTERAHEIGGSDAGTD